MKVLNERLTGMCKTCSYPLLLPLRQLKKSSCALEMKCKYFFRSGCESSRVIAVSKFFVAALTKIFSRGSHGL